MTAARAALGRRLEYLEQTSLALALAAPSTSAALGAEASRLRAEVDPADGAKPQPHSSHCAACGAVLIPGWSSTVSIQPSGGRLRKSLDGRRRKSNHPSRSEIRQGQPQLPLGRDHALKSVCLRCFRDCQKPLIKAGKGSGSMSAQRTRGSQSLASQPSAGKNETLQIVQGLTEPGASASRTLASGDSPRMARRRRKGGGLGSLLAQGQIKTHQDAKDNNLGLMDFLLAE